MRKKLRIFSVLSVLLIFAMLFAACGTSSNNAGSSSTSSSSEAAGSSTAGGSDTATSGADTVLKDGNPVELNLYVPGPNASPASLAEVESSMNSLIKDKIDATIKFNIVEWGSYADQLNLILSSGENADIAFTFSSTTTFAKNGQVQDITQLVQKYASDTYSQFDKYLDACKVNGALYGLPTFHEYAYSAGLVCRKDIFDQTGIDASTVKTWDDVENVLKKVREQNPKMNLLTNPEGSAGGFEYLNTGIFDILQNDSKVGIYVNKNQGDKLQVLSIFSTPEYMDMAKKAYDWNKKGYFVPDITTNSVTRQDMIKAGNTFGFVGQIHPGIVNQETNNSGKQMITVPITDAGSATANVNFAQYMIPTACKNPEKAVAFLNMLYSNKDIQNIYSYGIEGKDYVIKDKDKGIIGFPDGKDGTSVGWNMETWLTGNASISYTKDTDSPSHWQDYLTFNSKATISPLYGFVYDTTNVQNEIAAVKNVLSKYQAVIESGYADPNKSVAALNKELQDAGIQKIIDDGQQQVDKFLAAQKQ
jgi:putative aldouronate transport system substrate-binding protein